MIAMFSPTVGVLVSAQDEVLMPDIHYLAGQEPWTGPEALHLLSSINDWEPVDFSGDDLSPAIERCTLDYWENRARSLVVCLIEGISDSLTVEVLDHLESVLQSHCASDKVLNRLLISPLKAPSRVGTLASVSLSNGFGAIGKLFDRLLDLQPLLRRLASAWLNLPALEFVDLPMSREVFWQDLAEQSLLTKLLDVRR